MRKETVVIVGRLDSIRFCSVAGVGVIQQELVEWRIHAIVVVDVVLLFVLLPWKADRLADFQCRRGKGRRRRLPKGRARFHRDVRGGQPSLAAVLVLPLDGEQSSLSRYHRRQGEPP